MEPSSPSSQPDADVTAVLARAEQAVSRAAERLLVERLHRALDEQGSAAISSLSMTLLPLLQALAIVLPRALTDQTSPPVFTAAQTLGAALHEQGIALPDLLTEGLDVHEALLREIAAELRADDAPVIAAVLRISRSLLDVERMVLLAYQEEAAGHAQEPR